MVPGELRERVHAWMAEDPDERDRAELSALLADGTAEADADLADRFARRLTFGTAGLRGVVGAGPGRMNTATVTAATAALAGWLADRDSGAAEAGVVVGCDARHRSEEFALQTARVLAGAGLRVHLLPPRQPTPLLAFAVRQLHAAAGVMITASHNPRGDNGYKLYLGDGAQIVPPADTDIEAAIAALGPLSAVPLAAADSPLITGPSGEVARAYLDAICALAGQAGAGAAWLRFVYTPLHGVAGQLALRAFAQAGYAEPDLVQPQFEPDPEFPTVAFPNPEEPGTLDLAIAQARRSGADLVIANDPDGDRLAVAVPDSGAPGGYRQLTGDQVGALLGSFVLDRLADSGRAMHGQLVVSTVVSGTLLPKIAAAAGAQHAQTLTGFKWIVRAADRREDVRFAFGYEEALGYAVGDAVRDKDGIGAALAILHLANHRWSAGQTLQDAYDALEVAHGVHLTEQLSLPTEATVHVMARLRSAMPARLGDEPVLDITDYTGGTWDLPSADMLSYQLPGARVVIRPSGTEPKIKAYLEVVEPVAGRGLAVARHAAAERMDKLRDAARDLLA